MYRLIKFYIKKQLIKLFLTFDTTYFSDKSCTTVLKDSKFKLFDPKNKKQTCEKNQMTTAVLTDKEVKFFNNYFYNCITKNDFYRFKTLQNSPTCWTYFKIILNEYPRKFIKCDKLDIEGIICTKSEKINYFYYIFGGTVAFLFFCIGSSIIIYKRFKKVLLIRIIYVYELCYYEY